MKKLGSYFLYTVFLLLATLLLFELLFRLQVIDFYSYEFKSLNPEREASIEKEKTLVFGDSFSTYQNGYIEQLRKKNPSTSFINAAITGTGILQHRLFFEERIKQFPPKKVLYQFYVGNDFLDIHPPVNYKTLNLIRNVYWQASHYFLSLQYLNFKLAIFNRSYAQSSAVLQEDLFSATKYNQRSKIYLKGDPDYLANTILMQGNAKESYAIWHDAFSELIENLSDTTQLYLLLLPHCAQVHPEYKLQMEELGANIKGDIAQLFPPLYQQMAKDFPNVRILTPLSFFQELEKEGIQLYYGNDPHLNPEGQKLLAQFVQEQLNR
jgi:hypothetical protein